MVAEIAALGGQAVANYDNVATAAAILAGLYPVWRVSRLAPAGLLKTQ